MNKNAQLWTVLNLIVLEKFLLASPQLSLENIANYGKDTCMLLRYVRPMFRQIVPTVGLPDIE